MLPAGLPTSQASRSATRRVADSVSAWVVFLLLATGLALLAAFVANRWVAPAYPLLHTEGLGLPAGLVVFTSTDCPDCGALMEMLRGRSVPIREVTYELEPGLFERAGVDGVPLTAVLDEQGVVLDQAAGLPGARTLDKLIRAAS